MPGGRRLFLQKEKGRPICEFLMSVPGKLLELMIKQFVSTWEKEVVITVSQF